ncbi:MAG: hypothetical protein O3C28_09100 [Proteobacteria bacterium]|nr:hypothetical protein [Pseudomonadota bacterium]
MFIGLIIFGAWQHWNDEPLDLPLGVVAPDEPVQIGVEKNSVYVQGNYELKALAKFDIEARVLGKEIYHADRESELAPVDLALGWGAMSDSSVLEKLAISQGRRFYHYRWEAEPPRPPQEIAKHSANMHLIPTSSGLAEKMKNIRVGQVVHIVGQLVEARAPDGWRWTSSLTSNDTGAGACELNRVESLDIR